MHQVCHRLPNAVYIYMYIDIHDITICIIESIVLLNFHQHFSILLLQSFALSSRFVAPIAPKAGFGNSFMPPPPPMPFEGAVGWRMT